MLLPGLVALLCVTLLLTVGPRLPTAVLGALGPVGVVLIGVSIVTVGRSKG